MPHPTPNPFPGNPDRSGQNPLQRIPAEILTSLTPIQLEAVKTAIESAAQPTPKLVDLRFVVDLIVTRFFVVLLVGRDRRKSRRAYLPTKVSRVGNTIAAIVLLIGLNLLISLIILLFAYLLKSAIGIDLVPNAHLRDQVQKF